MRMPDAIKEARGTLEKKPAKASGKNEAKMPECPPRVSKDPVAKDFWDRMAPHLLTNGAIRPADEAVLASLAIVESQLSATLERLANPPQDDQDIGAIGVMVLVGNSLRLNPLWKVIEDLRKQELRLCTALGLTPESRTRVKGGAEEAEAGDEWDALGVM
jgi:P27 family predicted phage terminase small subunit